jgi:hypothetical protein
MSWTKSQQKPEIVLDLKGGNNLDNLSFLVSLIFIIFYCFSLACVYQSKTEKES